VSAAALGPWGRVLREVTALGFLGVAHGSLVSGAEGQHVGPTCEMSLLLPGTSIPEDKPPATSKTSPKAAAAARVHAMCLAW
jgi:hypothetical protein